MRKNFSYLTCVVLLFGCIATVSAQVSNDNEDGVNKVDSRFVKDFVPGQVLLKFKDESTISVHRNAQGRFRAASISAVDKLLKEYGVDEMEKLFPAEVAKPKARLRCKVAPNGSIVQERNLDKVFWIKTQVHRADSTMQLIEKLKEMPEVEYAEPNYLSYITADMPDGQYSSNSPQRVKALVSKETTANVICPKPSQNPLYFRQYGITQQNIHKLWDKPIINKKRPVIAILDTGVDINHPDLADNIWQNTKEVEGETAYDDDGNGLVDDKYGWNFIDNYYETPDRNGHGTHVAGIAAASDNEIGIVGANPLALIMPVKVMSDRGVGDYATIARGIVYAAENGADIINMSFGGPVLSSTMKNALDKAYLTSIIVASAGNNGVDIYSPNPPGTHYPAAYYLVLGVEASASNLQRASFSNYDPDGPIYSEDGADGRNYEVQVPGDKIYSTLPDGKYNQLSGTSMSAPLFAGAVSSLQMVKEYPSKDVLFSDLIHLKADFEKIYSDETPRAPKIDIVSLDVDDNVDSNNNVDGQVDVGETIKFTPVLRNTWTDATDIKLKFEVDPIYASFVVIENPEEDFGYSLSPYGRSAAKTPIKVKFANDIGDNTRIKFTITISCAEGSDTCKQDVYVTVNNKIYLFGIIDKDITLTSDKIWYWRKFYVLEGVTLNIEPGTRIVIETTDQKVDGKIVCLGTKERPIIFDCYNNALVAWIFSEVKYTHFINNFFNLFDSDEDTEKDYHVFDHCSFHGVYSPGCLYGNVCLNHCTIYPDLESLVNDRSSKLSFHNTNFFIEMSFVEGEDSNIHNSNILPSPVYDIKSLSYYSDYYDIFQLPDHIYFGTSNEGILRNRSYCYPEVGWGIIDYSNMRKVPISEAPGIVWKVVVNGKDAQDEYEDLAPLGVGKHKFEVYFNRPMNKNVAPQIAFGVREPYTQNAVAEDGSWNEEGTIYTAYKTITGKTKSDGVNRIYVWGAEDNEYFEIPYEKTRFNVMVNAAGSMATGFAAEPKLGRVELTWNNEENNFDDAMGFNIYRFTIDDKGNADTICINKEIVEIETTTFTDYDVKPGETYYYLYKVLSTDLKEYDVSNVVAATPLTATLGDANGSGDVDVADVITTVNQITGMEPKPFIFEAADMNVDQIIDVIDVIGIIQKILNPGAEARAIVESTAIYTIEDGTLYVESPVALAGVQVQLALDGRCKTEDVRVAEDLDGFEHTSAWLSDNDYLFLAYNMNGKTLSPGKHALLHISDALIASMRLSDANGHNIEVVGDDATKVNRMASDVMNVPGIYDLKGRKLTGDSTQEGKLPKGVYIINGKKVVK